MQQSVELALDLDSGELLEAHELMVMADSEHVWLRRDVARRLAARSRALRRNELAPSPRLVCTACSIPLSLSRWQSSGRNRWFKHIRSDTPCPWREALQPRDILALRYHGQQEGAQHRRLKSFIAQWLSREPNVADVAVEKTTFSTAEERRRRRPDVRCMLPVGSVVFEVQLSYTFLSVAVERDAFYTSEQTHLIWVFSRFDQQRSTTQDEFHFNRGNLFVLDEEAEQETVRRGRLTFKCYFHTYPQPDPWESPWTYEFVHLDALVYPTTGPIPFRPYYGDTPGWRQRLFTAAYAHCETAVLKAQQSPLRSAIADLVSRGYPEAGGLLHRLMCIAYDRRIGYDYATTFQILSAIRNSASSRSFFTLYLTAVRAYELHLAPPHKEHVMRWREEVRTSLQTDPASPFRGEARYDSVVALLFPRMKVHSSN